MKHILRSPFAWMVATILSAMLYFFAFNFFPKTFPIIHIPITMDLEQALEQANIIAEIHHIGPSEHQSAAMFHTDNTVKTFVELEAGGKDAFIFMMEENLYMPYTWQVRHFKEHEKNECKIIFTSDGKPYGFIEVISENLPGKQLSENDARTIAEAESSTYWNIDFSHYKLVEASQKTEISKRIDHIFVYERTDKKIGEGTYRLTIVVSGDKVTQVIPFVKIPESFARRYAEMRSANNTISFTASLIVLLYIFIGLFGLYWIFKKRWQLIKPSFICAAILASLSVLNSINQLPFLWMQYSTVFSANSFIVRLFLTFLITLIGQTSFYTLIIATAESLTRKAFGDHPQLWSVFSAKNSASYSILGRTLGAYLLVGLNIAFVVAFYLFSLNYLGWWSPSEMLFDPNILATYAPWFSPIALSLNAGFIEECLFRAIPLAGAALLGTHFGKRNWWIAGAFILQSIVFGAAHANYPVQPSYARLIELLIPSFIWGAMYLRFGLLSTIITHTVYDIILFSIPIFISHSSDTFTYKAIIIILTLLPLLRVLYARCSQGIFISLSESARNSVWQPLLVSDESKQESIVLKQPETESFKIGKKSILILGIIGLFLWISTTRFTHDGLPITLTREQAIQQSNEFLASENIMLNQQWQTLPLLFIDYKLVPVIANQHAFIWKKGKKDLYQALLGSYLRPAHWTVRYAQFDGDIVERAEEYKLFLYNDHSIYGYNHQLPESRNGISLTQQEARTIAHKAIQEEFNIDPQQLIEISAIQTQLPHRTDWLFTFADEAIYPLNKGQARISVVIAGNEVINITRFIHVSEEWERKEQNKQNILGITMLIFILALLFSLFIGLMLALRKKLAVTFSKKLFLIIYALVAIISIIDITNGWSNIVASFNTSLPFQDQLLQVVSASFITIFVKSFFYAATLTFVLSQKTTHMLSFSSSVSIGISIGLFVTGLLQGAQLLIPINMPLWPAYDALMYTIPILASCLNAISYYLQITTIFSLLFILINTATEQWRKNKIFFTLIAALCGMALLSLPSFKMLPFWIAIGGFIGYVLLALYTYILRYDYSLIPIVTATYVVLLCIQQGIFNAYPYAWLATIIKVFSVIVTTLLWHWYISKKD
jgi:hypothetical protein